MIHATPACSNISDAAFFDFFFDFFPNTRNTRGVTKGFLVGEHQQSHYAKYEYPPDDSIHVLPGGRHTWSTVRRRRTPSHLRDLIASTDVIRQREDLRALHWRCLLPLRAMEWGLRWEDEALHWRCLLPLRAMEWGLRWELGNTCFEGPPPAMLASAVRWREDTACVESFYQSKVLGFSLLVVA
jgi:hypothetical protein